MLDVTKLKDSEIMRIVEGNLAEQEKAFSRYFKIAKRIRIVDRATYDDCIEAIMVANESWTISDGPSALAEMAIRQSAGAFSISKSRLNQFHQQWRALQDKIKAEIQRLAREKKRLGLN